MKLGVLALVGAAALFLLPKSSAAQAGAAPAGQNVAASAPTETQDILNLGPSILQSAQRSGAVSLPATTGLTQAQAQSLLVQGQNLLISAVEQKNNVEVARALGQIAAASGNPIGVSGAMAAFIASTGTGANTSNPNLYVQTGGALRYVGAPSEGYSIGGGVF